jgi:hypothetical protein
VAGEDRHRSRRAEMARNVQRIGPTSRHRGVLQPVMDGEGRRGPHSVRGAAMGPSSLVVCGVVGCLHKIARMVP